MTSINRLIRRSLTVAVTLFLGAAGTASAVPTLIDFNALTHGEIVSGQYSSSGLTISAINIGGGPNLAVGFDTTLNNTADPDLEDPWAVGNLPATTVFGKALIIQENSDGIGDGIADRPDDEGSRPAGSIYFDFNRAITSFGFDLLDVEGPSEYGKNAGYFATFYQGGLELARVGFGALAGSSQAAGTVTFGDNSANRIDPITASSLGIAPFDRVEVNFGGSAALDNIVFNIPEPVTASLMLLGLAGFVVTRKQRR